jgi:hypothetical protein
MSGVSPRASVFWSVVLLLAAHLPGRAIAFSLNGYRWPDATQIAIHLQLTHFSNGLQDGSISWNASATDALNIWNESIDTVQFAAAEPSASSGTDGLNEVAFSNTVYGATWPSNVLAVTLKMSSQGSLFTETDVLFNDNLNWDSYRGPLQGRGPTTTFDFHRVALHEFGHVLGLDHPDQHGQSVVAQMNSIISDLDHLADDDIAGARALYGAKIISSIVGLTIDAGSPFNYQIRANNSPTSYDAAGLPPGLSVDPASGVISGSATSGGNFSVTLIAHGSRRDASAILPITVIASRIISTLSPPSVHVGDSFSYTIGATNHPFAFDAAGLPPGFSLDRSSGVITGVPSAIGTFSVTVTAHTSYGDGSATLTIRVVPFDITSNFFPPASLGNEVAYQITANNSPTSYEAIGLPAGFQLNASTGLITGTAALSGNYRFTVIAHGAKGDAVGSVTITVTAAPPLQPKPTWAIKTFDFSSQRLVFDAVRSRVYVNDDTSSMIVVIDSTSLTVIGTVKLPHPGSFLGASSGMALSRDNTKLWTVAADPVAHGGWITSIDLDKLAVLASFHVPAPVSYVAEGPGNRLYASGPSATFQLDATTGAVLATSNFQYGLIASSGDKLFMGLAFGAGVAVYDISQPQMQLLQQSRDLHGAGSGRDLKVSHNGKYLVSFAASGNSRVFGVTSTSLFSTADVELVLGNFVNESSNFSVPVGPAAFSNDDTVFYQPAALTNFADSGGTSRLEIFDVSSFTQIGVIDLGHVFSQTAPSVNDMVVDGTGAYIFVSTAAYNFTGQLRVYSTGRGTPPSAGGAADRSVLNVATRLRIAAGENAGIAGFIISGNEPKKVMIRAIGPSLGKAGVVGALADPALQVFDASGQQVGDNDNWNAHRTETLLSGLAPTDEHESALVLTLAPGSYTAIVRGVTASAGIAVVEVYDLGASGNSSRLANLSTRGSVGTGENVMIGGFIVGGTQATRVVVRAIGSSLTRFGVAGVLTDPMLEVHDGNGAVVAQDDDWRMYQEQLLIDMGLAPVDDHEAAMFLVLQPGAYTAIVRGKDNGTGVGLVEVYNLDAN